MSWIFKSAWHLDSNNWTRSSWMPQDLKSISRYPNLITRRSSCTLPPRRLMCTNWCWTFGKPIYRSLSTVRAGSRHNGGLAVAFGNMRFVSWIKNVGDWHCGSKKNILVRAYQIAPQFEFVSIHFDIHPFLLDSWTNVFLTHPACCRKLLFLDGAFNF
jgi:hypothetical protein